MNTKVGTPVVQQKTPVKVSTSPSTRKYSNHFRPYTSDKDTPPIKDIIRDGKLIEGISEARMIAEGSRPQLQYQNAKGVTKDGRPREVGRFEKTSSERKQWKEVHSCSKGPTGGTVPTIGKKEIKHTLIIHRANIFRKKDFVTTISVPTYPSQVQSTVRGYHNPDKHKIVTKYHYRGETVHVA